MNLHAIANGAVTAINPNTVGVIYSSAGYTTAPSGARSPTFTASDPVQMQVQALSGHELAHLDSLNIQGILRAIYVNGSVEGADRATGKGGDILAFNGQWWLVTVVLEPWDANGWTKVAATQQNGKPAGIP